MQKGIKPITLRQIDDRLRLPAQEMGVQILLILITGNMAQVGDMQRLGMNDGMEIGAGGQDLVIVDGQMGVELTRHTLKAAVIGGVHFPGLAAFVHHDAGNMCGGHISNFTQAPARAGHQEDGPGQLGDCSAAARSPPPAGKRERGSTGQRRQMEIFPAAPSLASISAICLPASPIMSQQIIKFRVRRL